MIEGNAMEAHPAQIIEFFSGFKQSVIPLFQRPYEWKQKQLDKLWQDLMERYEEENDINHFMGAIVTMPVTSVPVGVSKCMVIDGQQRLTTIAILLCVVRDELPEDAKSHHNQIQNHYLTNDGYEEWEYLKILPTHMLDDRTVFRALVLSQSTEGSSTILSAYRHLRSRVSGKASDGAAIDPKRLLEIIERRLTVVSINLGEADDPYLIVESLNFRGCPLTQAEVVRNYFLMRFTVNEQQRVYAQLWLPMQERLDAHVGEFMRQYLMMEGAEVVKAEIYPVLEKRVAALDAPAVEAELQRMADLAIHYVKLIRPEEEPDSGIRRCLDRLLRWDLTTAHPLLLRLYDSYEKKRLTSEDFVAALQMVESFAIRRAVCDISANQLKPIFLQLAKNFAESNTVSWLEMTLASGANGTRWPNDDECRGAWLSYQLYHPSRIDRCKLILEALEEHHKHKEPAAFQNAIIEHIMPVTLSDQWSAMLGPEAEDIHGQYLHTVGNVTLTEPNSEMSNDAFSKKQERVTESHFELNKYFGHVEVWNGEQIVARSKALWEQARHIWMRPGPGTSVEEDISEEDGSDTTTAELMIAAAIAFCGASASRIGKGALRYYRFADGKIIHFTFATFHASKRYHRYGIDSLLLPDMDDSGCSHVAFVLDTYGVALVPIEVVRKYLDTAKASEHPDGTSRRYHLLISGEPNVEMWSPESPRLSIGNYVKPFAKERVGRSYVTK